MALAWIRESPPEWDAGKRRIVGGAPRGIFDTRFAKQVEGDLVPGEWWRVEKDGRAVGYGWLDAVWGDAEILLAVDPEVRGSGVGTFIVDHLEAEAKDRGLNYIYNEVRSTHPFGPEVTAWLTRRGFRAAADGRLVRGAARRLSQG
jgi:N-acetylglutamate synthase-like GNAT family acetyltransferase